MKEEQQGEISVVSALAMPVVGNVLTILAGLAFLFLCMILPLVGPAAVRGSGSPGAGPAAHLPQNYMFFSVVLIVSLILTGLALLSKIERRKVDGSPLPYYTIVLMVVLVVLSIAYAFGWLAL